MDQERTRKLIRELTGAVPHAAMPSAPSSEEETETADQAPTHGPTRAPICGLTHDQGDAAGFSDGDSVGTSANSSPGGGSLQGGSLQGSSLQCSSLTATKRMPAVRTASSESYSESVSQLSTPAEQSRESIASAPRVDRREHEASAKATVAADFDIGSWDFVAAFSQQKPDSPDAAVSLSSGTSLAAESDPTPGVSCSPNSHLQEETAPHVSHIGSPEVESPEGSRDRPAMSASANDEACGKPTHRLSLSADSLDLYGPTPKVSKKTPSTELRETTAEDTAGGQERQLLQPQWELHQVTDAAAAAAAEDADEDVTAGSDQGQLAQPRWELHHATDAAAAAQDADEDADEDFDMESMSGKEPSQLAQQRWELHCAADAAAAAEEGDESSMQTSEDAASSTSERQAKVQL